MEPRTRIVIYGGGGFARELAWMISSCRREDGHPAYDVVCFADDDISIQGSFFNEVPVYSIEQSFNKYDNAKIVGGVGRPSTRQNMIEKAGHIGFEFKTIIHHSVEHSEWIKIGSGTVICAGNILTTNIDIGKHVQINLACTVGHDAIIGDFSTLAPGVHISGWVHIGRRVYVGTGAVIINGTGQSPLTIGDDAVIGAGACVTKSVPSNTTVVGVPARQVPRKENESFT